MKKMVQLFSVKQPIGTFYIGKILVKDLVRISFVNRRIHDNLEGIQRNLDVDRANKIKEYLHDPEATFPTSIILAIDSDQVSIDDKGNGIFELFYDNDVEDFAEVIDGQHRLEGLKKNPGTIEEVPIVMMFDLSLENKAYVFSTINSNQKPVSKSLIYDLYELSTRRSPIKTCHSIVKALNGTEGSPFYRRIKLLGQKQNVDEVISQGTFVSYMLKLISSNAKRDEIYVKRSMDIEVNRKLIFSQFYIDGRDDVIYKVISNYFGAVSEVFAEDWYEHKSILIKTTGIGGLFKALPSAFDYGIKSNRLDLDFFKELFSKTKVYMNDHNIHFSADEYGSGEQAQNNLSDMFCNSWKE